VPKTGLSLRQKRALTRLVGQDFDLMRLAFVLMIASLLSTGLAAREITDATGRRVPVPDRVERVMAAGPNAAVALYVLAPEKMVGWPTAPRPDERDYLLPFARDLPELGRLTGRGDTANVEVVIKARPDLIFDFGSVTPTYASLAARVREQTGIPYVLVDGRLGSHRVRDQAPRRGAGHP
jgi:iron complex transport system substrate-binding protein